MSTIKSKPLLLAPLVSIAVFSLFRYYGWGFNPSFTAAITSLCAIWWITEAIPIPVTALIPLSLFPLVGVLSRKDVTAALGNPIHFLLLGGFILSIAMINSNAHLRIATGIMQLIKAKNGRHLVWGFMAASALLSMWVSNAATTLMLLPIALAILESTKDKQTLRVPLLLGICYASSIGGMGTPIGTPPNLIFMEIYGQTTGREISFLDWMKWGVPVILCLLPIVAWKLTRKLTANEAIKIENRGKWQPAETRVLLIFMVTVLLWITRKDPYGGWSEWLGLTGTHDGYIALIAAILVFIIPDGKGKPLMNWELTAKVPWGIILLIAGGLALSTALKNTGLIGGLTGQLGFISGAPSIVLILIVCFSVTFITELMSNSASVALLLPLLAAVAIAANLDPILLMLPAALSASCAFMMPMATAPNAIIYGSNRVSIQDMMKQGFGLNLICALILALLVFIMMNSG